MESKPKKEEKVTEEEETAPIVCHVIDTGDFGFSSCGKCLSRLPDDEYSRCPTCGVKLGEVELGRSSGGSDF